jgi:hypothetical protein
VRRCPSSRWLPAGANDLTAIRCASTGSTAGRIAAAVTGACSANQMTIRRQRLLYWDDHAARLSLSLRTAPVRRGDGRMGSIGIDIGEILPVRQQLSPEQATAAAMVAEAKARGWS